MDYKETRELEENVKIANIVDDIIKGFNLVKLNVNTYKKGMFKVWSDSHNAEYVYIENGIFVFECDFLNERYICRITEDSLFRDIKQEYRGIDHLVAYINKFKESEVE